MKFPFWSSFDNLLPWIQLPFILLSLFLSLASQATLYFQPDPTTQTWIKTESARVLSNHTVAVTIAGEEVIVPKRSVSTVITPESRGFTPYVALQNPGGSKSVVKIEVLLENGMARIRRARPLLEYDSRAPYSPFTPELHDSFHSQRKSSSLSWLIGLPRELFSRCYEQNEPYVPTARPDPHSTFSGTSWDPPQWVSLGQDGLSFSCEVSLESLGWITDEAEVRDEKRRVKIGFATSQDFLIAYAHNGHLIEKWVPPHQLIPALTEEYRQEIQVSYPDTIIGMTRSGILIRKNGFLEEHSYEKEGVLYPEEFADQVDPLNVLQAFPLQPSSSKETRHPRSV